jgi:hypothetical protein
MPFPPVLTDYRMACSHCRREVTAERSADAAEPRCAACQTALAGGETQLPLAAEASAANAECGTRNAEGKVSGEWYLVSGLHDSPLTAHHSPPNLDDPDLADDLRRTRRLLRIDAAHADHEPMSPAALLAGERAHLGPAKRGRKPRRARRKASVGSLAARFWGGLTWLVVCAGGMALTFGAGLLACAQLLHRQLWQSGSLASSSLAGSIAKRDDLWNWGLLTALAGQFLLFLGFALRRSSSRVSRSHDSPVGKRKSSDAEAPPPQHRLSPTAPLWSPRCEAVLGLSLDSVDRI